MNTTIYPHEIKAGAATIRVLSETRFLIDDSPEDGQGTAPGFVYGPYDVESTADLSTVAAILKNPAWDEDDVTRAVEALNPQELEKAQAQRRRDWRRRMAAEFNWDREEVA